MKVLIGDRMSAPRSHLGRLLVKAQITSHTCQEPQGTK